MKTILALLLILLLSLTAMAQFTPGQSVTIAAGTVKTYQIALYDVSRVNVETPYPLPFTEFQIKVDSIAGSGIASGLIDSVTVQYCKALGLAAADTMARQPGALRYMIDYTGGQVDSSMAANHSWIYGKWHVGEIQQDGHPYWFLTLKVSNLSAYPYAVTFKINQAGVRN